MERKSEVSQAASPQNFQIYADLNFQSLSSLSIHEDTLTLEFLGRQIDWKNILAIDVLESQTQRILTTVQITLFSKQKRWLRQSKRKMEKLVFFVMPQCVDKMLVAVRRFMTHSSIDHPKFLVFHNPISGKNSLAGLEKGVTFIKRTHFQFQLVTTNHKGHCKEYLKQHCPSNKDYWGIAIFSGDGLMHQFVNSDCSIPVIHVPVGSGNAFAKNQAQLSGEDCGVQENLFIAMKGLTTTGNAIEFEFENQAERIFGMVNFQWAFLSDIDIKSEVLRWLGVYRFDVYSAWRLLRPRTYPGKVTFSVSQTELPDINVEINSPEFETRESSFYHLLLTLLPWISTKHRFAPLFKMKSQYIDLQMIPQASGQWETIKYFVNAETGKHFDMENRCPRYEFEHQFIKSFRLQPTGQDRGLFCIDGEQYQTQKIQGKLVPDKFKMFALYE